MDAFTTYNGMHWNEGGTASSDMLLLSEEPLSIRVQGNPYAVIMRTPGDEIAHVAGFCLSEGVIDRITDAANIAFCDGDDTNVVTVTLTAAHRKKIGDIADRRGFVSQSSCGICGKEVVKDLTQTVQPVQNANRMTALDGLACLEKLPECQKLHRLTRASHAAAIYDPTFARIASAEDLGRHNAVDKAIGKLLVKNELNMARLITVSSRVSYEIVQKVGRAGIPYLFSISRPTALAVNLAAELNITLACSDKKGGMYVFSGKNNLI